MGAKRRVSIQAKRLHQFCAAKDSLCGQLRHQDHQAYILFPKLVSVRQRAAQRDKYTRLPEGIAPCIRNLQWRAMHANFMELKLSKKRPKLTRFNWSQQPLIYSKQEKLREQFGRGDLTAQKLKGAQSKTCLLNCLSSSHLHFN